MNDSLPPTSVLKAAIKAVPAVKYALGIGGIVAVIAIIAGFGIDFRVALFGAVAMLILMTMLVIFASLAKQKSSSFHLPAVVFTWFSLVLVMSLAIVLFTSVFWGRPVDLRKFLGLTLDSGHTTTLPDLKPDSRPSASNEVSPGTTQPTTAAPKPSVDKKPREKRPLSAEQEASRLEGIADLKAEFAIIAT